MKVMLAVYALLAAGAMNAQAAGLTNSGHMPQRVRAAAAKGSLLLSFSPIVGTVLSKNVAAVSNPGTGIFCVTPTKALPTGSLPTISVEWGSSFGNALLAYLEIAAQDCGSGQIEVRTFDFDAGGAPAASQNVAFDLFVP